MADDMNSEKTPLDPKTTKYVQELMAEKGRLTDLPHATKLIQDEINNAIKSGRHKPEDRFLDLYRSKTTKVNTKVEVPQKAFPNFNFVGKLLGPKGISMKKLQEETQCRMSILGRGSIKDKKKEEEMRNSLDPKYAHLTDELYVEISALAEPAEAYARIAYALAELRKCMTPDNNDDMGGHMEMLDDGIGGNGYNEKPFPSLRGRPSLLGLPREHGRALLGGRGGGRGRGRFPESAAVRGGYERDDFGGGYDEEPPRSGFGGGGFRDGGAPRGRAGLLEGVRPRMAGSREPHAGYEGGSRNEYDDNAQDYTRRETFERKPIGLMADYELERDAFEGNRRFGAGNRGGDFGASMIRGSRGGGRGRGHARPDAMQHEVFEGVHRRPPPGQLSETRGSWKPRGVISRFAERTAPYARRN